MKQSVLITGAAGFTGRYLCRHLRSAPEDLNIVGIDICEASKELYDAVYTADIVDTQQVKGVLNQVKPNYIIHLAGTFGTEDIQQLFKVNVLSMTSILEAVLKEVPKSVFLATGSAAEYGKVDASHLPVTEQCPCNPVMPYGLSKYLATQIAQYYYRTHGLCTMVVRPFQLIGKGVTSRLAPGAFANRLLEARQAGLNEIKVGNLESSRDFLDIRDAVRAILMLCQKPAPGETFNLCGGRPVKIADLLNMMITAMDVGITPVTEEKYLRGNTEVDIIYGCYGKIKAHCGWSPEIPLLDSINSMMKNKNGAVVE
jgi:GDP-4-dehydro-6-deoxy-D-mannose reductase